MCKLHGRWLYLNKAVIEKHIWSPHSLVQNFKGFTSSWGSSPDSNATYRSTWSGLPSFLQSDLASLPSKQCLHTVGAQSTRARWTDFMKALSSNSCKWSQSPFRRHMKMRKQRTSYITFKGSVYPNFQSTLFFLSILVSKWRSDEHSAFRITDKGLSASSKGFAVSHMGVNFLHAGSPELENTQIITDKQVPPN